MGASARSSEERDVDRDHGRREVYSAARHRARPGVLATWPVGK